MTARRRSLHARRRRFAEENARPGQTLRRGMGLCTFLHGTGFTGSGEKHLASLVTVEGAADGRVRVLTSSTEIGQGTQTVFAQIAAAALGVGVDDIEVAATDTRDVPDSGPTVASRTCTIVGKLVQDAATTLRQTLLDSGLLQPDREGRLGPAVVDLGMLAVQGLDAQARGERGHHAPAQDGPPQRGERGLRVDRRDQLLQRSVEAGVPEVREAGLRLRRRQQRGRRQRRAGVQPRGGPVVEPQERQAPRVLIVGGGRPLSPLSHER